MHLRQYGGRKGAPVVDPADGPPKGGGINPDWMRPRGAAAGGRKEAAVAFGRAAEEPPPGPPPRPMRPRAQSVPNLAPKPAPRGRSPLSAGYLQQLRVTRSSSRPPVEVAPAPVSAPKPVRSRSAGSPVRLRSALKVEVPPPQAQVTSDSEELLPPARSPRVPSPEEDAAAAAIRAAQELLTARSIGRRGRAAYASRVEGGWDLMALMLRALSSSSGGGEGGVRPGLAATWLARAPPPVLASFASAVGALEVTRTLQAAAPGVTLGAVRTLLATLRTARTEEVAALAAKRDSLVAQLQRVGGGGGRPPASLGPPPPAWGGPSAAEAAAAAAYETAVGEVQLVESVRLARLRVPFAAFKAAASLSTLRARLLALRSDTLAGYAAHTSFAGLRVATALRALMVSVADDAALQLTSRRARAALRELHVSSGEHRLTRVREAAADAYSRVTLLDATFRRFRAAVLTARAGVLYAAAATDFCSPSLLGRTFFGWRATAARARTLRNRLESGAAPPLREDGSDGEPQWVPVPQLPPLTISEAAWAYGTAARVRGCGGAVRQSSPAEKVAAARGLLNQAAILRVMRPMTRVGISATATRVVIACDAAEVVRLAHSRLARGLTDAGLGLGESVSPHPPLTPRSMAVLPTHLAYGKRFAPLVDRYRTMLLAACGGGGGGRGVRCERGFAHRPGCERPPPRVPAAGSELPRLRGERDCARHGAAAAQRSGCGDRTSSVAVGGRHRRAHAKLCPLHFAVGGAR